MHTLQKRNSNPQHAETPQPSTTSRSSAIRPPPRNADDRSRTKDRVDLGASAPFLGKQFTVGAADDPHEREADRAAEQVMRFLESDRSSSRALKINASDGQAPRIQRQFTPASTSPAIARNGNSGRIGASGGPLSPAIARGIENAGGGEALPAETLSGFNAAFRADFSRVRVHADDRAEKLNEQLSSRAFSVGPDLFFKRSEYRPQTYAGQKLLAHELAHVRQHQKHPGLRRMVRRYYWRGPDGSVQWIDGDPDHELQMTVEMHDDGIHGEGYIYEKAAPAAERPKRKSMASSSAPDPQSRSALTRQQHQERLAIARALFERILTLIDADSARLEPGIKPIIHGQDHNHDRQSRPTSFADQRPTQTRRHIATTVYWYLKKLEQDPREVQTAVDEDDPTALPISSNMNASNQKLRALLADEKLGADLPARLRAMAREVAASVLNGELIKQNPNFVIRTLRHCAKLLQDAYEQLDQFESAAVPDDADEDGLHAELRLLDADFSDPVGVKRPCAACFLDLRRRGVVVHSAGPIWITAGALQSLFAQSNIAPGTAIRNLTADDIEKLAKAIVPAVQAATLTAPRKPKTKPTHDYGTDSDSDFEDDPAADSPDAAMLKAIAAKLRELHGKSAKQKKRGQAAAAPASSARAKKPKAPVHSAEEKRISPDILYQTMLEQADAAVRNAFRIDYVDGTEDNCSILAMFAAAGRPLSTIEDARPYRAALQHVDASIGDTGLIDVGAIQYARALQILDLVNQTTRESLRLVVIHTDGTQEVVRDADGRTIYLYFSGAHFCPAFPRQKS